MRIWLFSTLLISSSVIACPNLAGTYRSCVSSSQESQPSLKVTQETVNDVVVYTITSTDTQTNENLVETYKADGKVVTASETDPETGDIMKITSTVSCVGSKSLKIKLDVLFNDSLVSDILTTASKNGNTLTVMTKGTTMGENINETVVCN